jgi:multisubunit Na+/H+ antiporter MnhG subunit
MTDMPPASAPGAPDRAQMFRNIGLSLLVNALVPYLVYRLAAPHYPKDSVTPLLFSTIVPALWLAWGLTRKRTVDAISIIAICEVTVTIAVTLLAASVSWALIARATQGALVGLVFAGSVLIGRPIIYYIARQFSVGMNPERAAGFDRAHTLDKGRTFSIATLVWSVGLILLSAIHVTLAVKLAPADYLLAAPVVGISGNIALLVWSIRFSMRRLQRYRPA